VRRTVAYTTPTDATPISACGARTVKLENPKGRANATPTQSAAGGLSTVMMFPASSEPNSQALVLWVPAWTAAA
jgi:hypothetical protein